MPARHHQRSIPTGRTWRASSELPPNLSRLWGVANDSGYNSNSFGYTKCQNAGLGTRGLAPPGGIPTIRQTSRQFVMLMRGMDVVTVTQERCGKAELQLWLARDVTRLRRLCHFDPRDRAQYCTQSWLGCVAVSIPDGAEVAQIKVVDTNNTIETHSLLAGRDVSDWAYDCETVKHSLKHRRAQIFENFAAKVYEESCQGHYYRSNFKLDGRKNIKSIELRWTGPSGSLILDKLSLIDDEIRSSRPVDPMTMGHNWRFVEERNGSQVFENLAALPRVWLVPEVVVLEAEEIQWLPNFPSTGRSRIDLSEWFN